MQVKTLAAHSFLISLRIPNFRCYSPSSVPFNDPSLRSLINGSRSRSSLRLVAPGIRRNCIGQNQELVGNEGIELENESNLAKLTSFKEEEEEDTLQSEVNDIGGLENRSIWNQVKEIVMFTGPATGLWLCGPLMSLIDTAVIGQGSSIELAALGPGTVLCDYFSYIFMFLSVATSNMVATSLAKQDKNEVQHQISTLLFLGLTCGALMLVFTKFFGSWALSVFTGPKIANILPAANTYIQIRGLAWPAILVGWVAQSASLGMKDSWGPLKALAVASVVNAVGDVVLCSILGYGITGAAWATMVSQIIAAYMMIRALAKKGYNALTFSFPTPNELLTILGLAAPVFVTMISKVAFYSLMVYFATSMGTHALAAHQVMIQTASMFAVCSEPLSQTAQSFMPELIYGVKRSLSKARMLLKSLLVIGATVGLVMGTIGTSVPLLFPNIFTPDQMVIQEMHKVLLPYFLALSVSSFNHSLEGTLMAGRDLKFLSLSTCGCFFLGASVMVFASSKGYGLPWLWFALVGFQWARFFSSLRRLLSRDGMLYSEDNHYEMGKLRAA